MIYKVTLQWWNHFQCCTIMKVRARVRSRDNRGGQQVIYVENEAIGLFYKIIKPCPSWISNKLACFWNIDCVLFIVAGYRFNDQTLFEKKNQIQGGCHWFLTKTYYGGIYQRFYSYVFTSNIRWKFIVKNLNYTELRQCSIIYFFEFKYLCIWWPKLV